MEWKVKFTAISEQNNKQTNEKICWFPLLTVKWGADHRQVQCVVRPGTEKRLFFFPPPQQVSGDECHLLEEARLVCHVVVLQHSTSVPLQLLDPLLLLLSALCVALLQQPTGDWGGGGVGGWGGGGWGLHAYFIVLRLAYWCIWNPCLKMGLSHWQWPSDPFSSGQHHPSLRFTAFCNPKWRPSFIPDAIPKTSKVHTTFEPVDVVLHNSRITSLSAPRQLVLFHLYLIRQLKTNS